MQLTGPQLKRLHPLLLWAFPSYRELKRLALFGLDLNLDTIVDTHDLNAAVFDLLDWSHARDKDGELVAAAVEANPDNQALHAFAIEVGTIAAPTPASPTQPRFCTLIVDQMHRGDYPTISAAIAAANAGDRITVRPGIYDEGLVIDKPLEIIGDGDCAEIVVRTNGADVILFQATAGRVQNLTLRQTGGDGWCGVDVSQGRLELEDCDISSVGWACVAIHHQADPRLRRNCIHDGGSVGVIINENGQGTLEDNDVFANAHAGVAIVSNGNPTLRRNRIHDGKNIGVFIYENGQGNLEDNDIFANAQIGVGILTGGNATLRNNRINANELGAIRIGLGGSGTFENNDLRGNAGGAWKIDPECLPNVRRSGNIE